MAVTIFLSATNIPQICAQLRKNADYATTLFLILAYNDNNGGRGEHETTTDLSHHAWIKSLQEAVQVNHTITHLVISAASTFNGLPRDDQGLEHWFRVIITTLAAGLPALKDVKIQLATADLFDKVIGPSVTDILDKARNLQRLYLDRVELGHTVEQVVHDWVRVLTQPTIALEEFGMEACRLKLLITHDENDAEEEVVPVLDPLLLSGLCKIPTLKRVSLIGMMGLEDIVRGEGELQVVGLQQAKAVFSCEALTVLPCRIPGLTKLECHGWAHVSFQQFFPSQLPSTTTILTNQLDFLTIGFQGENKLDFALVEDFLRAPSSSVRSFQLVFQWPPDCASKSNDNGIIGIAKALSSNTFLTKFGIQHVLYSSPDQIMDALVKSLENNYSLQITDVFSEMPIAHSPSFTEGLHQLGRFLKYNRNGRGALLLQQEDATSSPTDKRDAWVQMLILERDDIHGLFYYLSANPSLCAVAGRH